jgi:hypothetical protein
MFYDIEQVREATTPSEMRIEISRLRRSDSLVRGVMDSADYTGMSAEDRFTMLSYHALCALAKHKKVLHDYVLMTPSPPLVTCRIDNQEGRQLRKAQA